MLLSERAAQLGALLTIGESRWACAELAVDRPVCSGASEWQLRAHIGRPFFSARAHAHTQLIHESTMDLSLLIFALQSNKRAVSVTWRLAELPAEVFLARPSDRALR